MRQAILSLALAFCLAITLNACGKKSPPEPPTEKKSEYPRQYPE